jgi:hypothetical protein
VVYVEDDDLLGENINTINKNPKTLIGATKIVAIA